jgi:hypothetical protein
MAVLYKGFLKPSALIIALEGQHVCKFVVRYRRHDTIRKLQHIDFVVCKPVMTTRLENKRVAVSAFKLINLVAHAEFTYTAYTRFILGFYKCSDFNHGSLLSVSKVYRLTDVRRSSKLSSV